MNLGIIMNFNKTNVSFTRVFAKIKYSRKFSNLQFCLLYSLGGNHFIFMGGGEITLVQEIFSSRTGTLLFIFCVVHSLIFSQDHSTNNNKQKKV